MGAREGAQRVGFQHYSGAGARSIATLEDGATVNKFLTRPPGVTCDQAEAVPEDAKRSLAVAWARKGSRSASRNTRCWRP